MRFRRHSLHFHPATPARRVKQATAWEIIGLNRLSLCYTVRGDKEQAIASALRGLELSQTLEDSTVLGLSRFFYGRALLRAGQTALAMEQFNPPPASIAKETSYCPPIVALCKEPSEEHLAYLRELIEAGVDLSVVDDHGYSALDYAVFAGELVRGRTFRRRHLPERSSPAYVLMSINTILHERQLEEYYCTLNYSIFDLKRRTVTMANSGLPYAIRCTGDTCAPIELAGVPLGSFPGSMYDEVTFDLHAGDIFVICTDGVFEAMNEAGQEFTADRLMQVVTETAHLPASRIVEAIASAVETWRDGADPNDDMTAVAVKITA